MNKMNNIDLDENKSLFGRNLDETGQHYMIDKKLVQFIVDSAELKKNDVVLEIGYGKGALTKELIKKCHVIAVDIEKNELGLRFKNIEFIHANILDTIDDLKFNKIVSNIPYNISEPLMKRLFKKNFEVAVLTVGKDFSKLLTEKNNRIGIIANHLYNIESLQDVKRDAFFPSPRIKSAVIKIIPKKELNGIELKYRSLVFLDDKKIKNAVEKIVKDKTKKELMKLMKNFGHEKIFEKKIYELSNEEFVEFDGFLKTLM